MPRQSRTFAYHPATARPLTTPARVCLDCPATAVQRCQRCDHCRRIRRKQMAAVALARNNQRYRHDILSAAKSGQVARRTAAGGQPKRQQRAREATS